MRTYFRTASTILYYEFVCRPRVALTAASRGRGGPADNDHACEPAALDGRVDDHNAAGDTVRAAAHARTCLWRAMRPSRCCSRLFLPCCPPARPARCGTVFFFSSLWQSDNLCTAFEPHPHVIPRHLTRSPPLSTDVRLLLMWSSQIRCVCDASETVAELMRRSGTLRAEVGGRWMLCVFVGVCVCLFAVCLSINLLRTA